MRTTCKRDWLWWLACTQKSYDHETRLRGKYFYKYSFKLFSVKPSEIYTMLNFFRFAGQNERSSSEQFTKRWIKHKNNNNIHKILVAGAGKNICWNAQEVLQRKNFCIIRKKSEKSQVDWIQLIFIFKSRRQRALLCYDVYCRYLISHVKQTVWQDHLSLFHCKQKKEKKFVNYFCEQNSCSLKEDFTSIAW